MVASDRAMMLLSSLMASVTLRSGIVSRQGGGEEGQAGTYISWLGFFFFLRMAVAVSSS